MKSSLHGWKRKAGFFAGILWRLPVLGLTAVGDDGTINPINAGISVATPAPSPLAIPAENLSKS